MKKKSVGLGAVLCAVVAILATGWWIYVDWFDSEASSMVRGESLFGALLWWALFLFVVGGFPSMNENETITPDHTETPETINQPKEDATL